MTKKYTPRSGDHVRVVLEGYVRNAAANYFEIAEKPDAAVAIHGFANYDEDVVSIEKIEPPFKPGDILRGKATGRVVVITEGGFVDTKTGQVHTEPFGGTPAWFERVELS